MNFTKSTLTLAVSSALLFSLSATANETQATNSPIEVITVSSDFRQQNLLKTPTSLSVLSDIEIKQRNAQHLEELIAVSPNVNYASGSQRARYYQIRGIGERAQFKEPINPSVGMIIDEVDFTGIGSIANLFDTSQVEIFRGPQGTRFGANALAGMINITTNTPSDEFEGAIKLDAGNYDSYGLGLALSGPATDDVNYRFAINKQVSDGFMENVYLDTDDTNNRNELNIRGKLSIAATNDLTIDLTGFYFDFNNGYDAFSLDKTRTTYSDEPGFDDQETKALAAKFTYEGFDGFTLVSILSTADSDLAYGYDEDWAYEGISYPENIENQDFAYWEYTSKDHYFREKSVQTIEFRALSKTNNKIFNDTTSWVTGIHFKQDDEELLRQYTYLASDFSSSFDTQSIAVYGQLDSQLDNQWALSTGLRVEHRSADYINSDSFDDNLNDTMIGGKLVLSYQHSDDKFWYASINRGFILWLSLNFLPQFGLYASPFAEGALPAKTTATLFSLGANIFVMWALSQISRQSVQERVQASLFLEWQSPTLLKVEKKRQLDVNELELLASRFVGDAKAKSSFNLFQLSNNKKQLGNVTYNQLLLQHTENTFTCILYRTL